MKLELYGEMRYIGGPSKNYDHCKVTGSVSGEGAALHTDISGLFT
jgi:hypothetical protein